MNEIASLYSQSQQGGELPYFIGKHYGTGWLRNIARFAFPILKRLGRAAVNTASGVIMKNKSTLPSLKTHATEEVGAVISSLISTSKSTSSKANINKRRKRSHGTIFSK